MIQRIVLERQHDMVTETSVQGTDGHRFKYQLSLPQILSWVTLGKSFKHLPTLFVKQR